MKFLNSETIFLLNIFFTISGWAVVIFYQKLRPRIGIIDGFSYIYEILAWLNVFFVIVSLFVKYKIEALDWFENPIFTYITLLAFAVLFHIINTVLIFFKGEYFIKKDDDENT